MTRILALALACLIAVPAIAAAAAKPGSYSGTSSAKILDPATAGRTETTDKGKVTFKASRSKVTGFKLKGQLITCGRASEAIPISVRTIKLSSSGKGTGTYTNPNVGPFKITITVTSRGKAFGTIRSQGLCQAQGPVRFSAKRG